MGVKRRKDSLSDSLQICLSYPLLHISLFFFEAVLCSVIIYHISYTEIDWKAYMQEVDGFLEGNWNYSELKGDTGPLVYPAGFVYFYSVLFWLTSQGESIISAQIIFLGLYLFNLLVTWKLYRKSGLPWYYFIAVSLFSYRVHSLFLLRMFNDCICALLCYMCVLFITSSRFKTSALLFTLALSVKMNALLLLPGICVVLVCSGGLRLLVQFVALSISLLILVSSPFLYHDYHSYISKAFEFNRQFFFKWTVNWRFVGEDWFLDSNFHLLLLCLHVTLLILFGWFVWRPRSLKLLDILNPNFRGLIPLLSSREMCVIIFESNFIGIICSRTLHYQFYVWYYHSLPILLFNSGAPLFIQLVLFLCIEYSWNVYPSTGNSSSLLLGCHLILLCYCFSRVFVTKHKKSKTK